MQYDSVCKSYLATLVFLGWNIGVTQGNTVGLHLFIVYFINLHKWLNVLKLLYFVNDTTLYLSNNPSMDHPFLKDSEITQAQWRIVAKKIIPNSKELIYMIISSRIQIVNMFIPWHYQPIARTFHQKILSISNDDKLKFDKHINELCSKNSQSFGLIMAFFTSDTGT